MENLPHLNLNHPLRQKMTHCHLKSGFWVGIWCHHIGNQHWTSCLHIYSLWSVGLIWLLLSEVELSPYFSQYFTVTKCCKAHYHRVISSANTMCTINTAIWNINTCLTKQALDWFQDYEGGFIVLFLHFLNLKQRRWLYCSFSSFVDPVDLS